MAYGVPNILLPYGQAAATPDEYLGIAINWFTNRTPLATRLRRVPVNSDAVKLIGCDYRPGTATITEAFGDTSGTTITLSDGTQFAMGDVIRIDSEYMEITTTPAADNTATVVRGVCGTTAATHSDNAAVYLIGNSRTGGEVDVVALGYAPAAVTQYPQTFQFAYQVGGSVGAQGNTVVPPGLDGILGRERMLAMQHCMDDMERSSYYGKAAAHSSTVTRQKQAGLQALLTTNNTTSPTNASAYKPSDLVRDLPQKCFDGGGSPNLLLVASNWMTAFSIWGMNVIHADVGYTAFGGRIKAFYIDFLEDILVVPSQLMLPFHAVMLNSDEVMWGDKRPIFDKPRGSRGDAVEGDIIAEGCVLVQNQAHHAWLQGVTAFAKQS